MTGELVATILGCGPSPGVPRIGNDWGRCDPSEPRNRRSRCSLLLARHDPAGGPSTQVLFDTSPDMRQQLLAANVNHLDAVLYTHAHADHLHGIDDLRAFWMKTRRLVDVYADETTAMRIHEAFRYCFETPAGGSYPPTLRMNRVTAYEPLVIIGPAGPLDVLPFTQRHGTATSVGYRIGGLAYSCDVSGLDDRAAAQLENLDVWIVDALRHEPHPSHFSVAEALAWIERLKPRRAVLTHMDSPLDYNALRRELPDHVEPAYDGMVIAL
ncbi:MAG: MBL fold metallo-hydrolase [Bauldia sp.]|nr:MBL fold metallo-hydrolase [Bauldia sp.]